MTKYMIICIHSKVSVYDVNVIVWFTLSEILFQVLKFDVVNIILTLKVFEIDRIFNIFL